MTEKLAPPDFSEAKRFAVKAAKRFARYFQVMEWEWGNIGIPDSADIVVSLLEKLNDVEQQWRAGTWPEVPQEDNRISIDSHNSGGLEVVLFLDFAWGFEFRFIDEQTLFGGDDDA